MITLNRQELRDVLYRFVAVSRDTSADSPLMGQVVNGDLMFWYDSFEFSIWSVMPSVKGELDLFSIPLDKIYRILGSWSKEDVKLISLEDNKLRISCGRNRITVPYYEGYNDEIEFPPEGEFLGELPTDMIKSFTDVMPFLSKVEEMDGVLSCSRFFADDSQIHLWGCDKVHLYMRGLDYEGSSFNYLLPTRTTDILVKLLRKDMQVSMYELENGFLLFETDAGFTLQIVPFNKTNYPDLLGVIAKDFKELFSFNYDEMLEMIRILESLDTSHIMGVYSEDDEIRIRANESDYDSDLYLEEGSMLASEFDFRCNTTFLRNCMDVFFREKGLTCKFSETSNMLSVSGKDKTKILALMVYGNAAS